MEKLYCIAMEKEAIQIAEKLGLEKISNEIYRKENTSLLITGIGKQRTAISLTKYICENGKPDKIINIGYAGSTILVIGKWYCVSYSMNYEWEIPGEEKYDMLDYGFKKLDKVDKLEEKPCYSAECFVTDTDLEEECLFDMELHSISILCDKYDIPLVSIKKVSDNLSFDGYYENLKDKNIFELTSGLDILKD